MAARKIRYGKIPVVIFLTLLIWVWADMAEDEKWTVSNAEIIIAKSINQALSVSFENGSSFPLQKIVLKGPASKIVKAQREMDQGLLKFKFFFDPDEQKEVMTGPDELNVLALLRQNKSIKQRSLSIESCEPEIIAVKIRHLVKKTLEIKCIDKNNYTLKTKTIDPSEVKMLVPEDWQGEKLISYIQLSDSEKDQAMGFAIIKIPFITIDGRTRRATTAIKITLPPKEETLKEFPITKVTLGYLFSKTMLGKYDITVTNLHEVIPIRIAATDDAKFAYEQQRFHVFLEIDDEDINTEEPRRKLIYNFPTEFIGKGEIELKSQPVEVQFNLIPVQQDASP